MKLTLCLLVSALLGFSVFGKHFWRGELKSIEDVCSTWGTLKFESEKFKSGKESLRAQMSCDLLRSQKKFFGKDVTEIRKELGGHNGFYFTDLVPAYLTSSGKTKKEDTWQLVFLLDNKYAVSEIVVHKNCCKR